MILSLTLLSVIATLGAVSGQQTQRVVHTSRWVGGPADFNSIWNYLVKQFSVGAQGNPFAFFSKFGNTIPNRSQPMGPKPPTDMTNGEAPPRNPGEALPLPPMDSPNPAEIPMKPGNERLPPPMEPDFLPAGPDNNLGPLPADANPLPNETNPPADYIPPETAGSSPSEPLPAPEKRRQNYCTDEYRKLPGHTLCMRDKPNVVKSGMTQREKTAVLRHHNDLRATVEPAATDLVKLKWDDRLAAVAQKWANQCAAGHDKMRDIPSIGMAIGQNVAGGYRSWHKAVQMWFDEIKMWTYGVDPDSYLGPGGWRKIGHFTQMVQNGTFLVGCGYAECAGSMYTRYYVCDYAAGQSNLATPYTAGRRCSKCPRSCVKGQCDCGGRVCMNGGSLNPNTCQCTCSKTYKGPTCEDLNCPAEDAFVCERDWPKSFCTKFSNVPDECPYMCGICKGGSSSTGGSGGPATEFVSDFGCKYKGKRSSPAECRKFGDQGKDIKQCASSGGQIGCTDCKRYFNVKKEMCPVMCGLCDPPCGGKQCHNGGTLNVDTCKCTCAPPYIASTDCRKADCRKQDPKHCQFWPPAHCGKFYNVPQECPYLCGICKKRG